MAVLLDPCGVRATGVVEDTRRRRWPVATASRVGYVPSYVRQAGRGRVAMGMPSTMGVGMAAHVYVVDVIRM